MHNQFRKTKFFLLTINFVSSSGERVIGKSYFLVKIQHLPFNF